MSIVVAMSGGIDSCVAALLLKEQGHECIGVSMQLWDVRRTGTPSGCCSPDDLFDARLVADTLGFPYYVLNYEDGFEEQVVRPFVRDYLAGRTPSPCVQCNNEFKFGHLWNLVRTAGASAVATGHYARLQTDGGRVCLLRGRDRSKDQSYFLHGLGQEDLRRVLFPVGDLTKEEVRDHARRVGWGIAEKVESQDICFAGQESYSAFVEDFAREQGMEAPAMGEVVTASGEVLASHTGIHQFTPGQRKGLGVSTGNKLYVLRIRPESGQVVVGGEEQLGVEAIECDEVNWVSIGSPARSVEAEVQVRYRHPGSPALIEPKTDGSVRVTFRDPERAPAPGQAAVFYEGERVLGGGVIERVLG